MTIDVDALLRESAERRAREAAERRAEFFAERTAIPDLEFLTPDCPMCGLSTDAEDSGFICEGCETVWRGNGYGHEAFRWNEPTGSEGD